MITSLLGNEGYEITAAQSAEEALEILKKESFDLMISDVNMHPTSGLILLEKTRESYPDMGVIMLTGHDDLELALYAMKKGAFDFLVKPFQLQNLLATVLRTLEYYHTFPKSDPLKVRVGSLKEILVESASMEKIVNLIRRVAPTTVTVLFSAEAGSNKTLFARTLHYYSDRKDKPFLALDCATYPAEQMTEKLFGASVKNPSLLEAARGGTVFLNNINGMPLDTQAELLRVLQEQNLFRKQGENFVGGADVRITVGACIDLEELVKRGAFLETLYCRLSAFRINIPPLRDRRQDIIPLAYQVLEHAAEDDEDRACELSCDAQNILYYYDWPGNVRELKEVLSDARPRAKNRVITKELLPEKIHAAFESRKNTMTEPLQRKNLRGSSFRELLQKKIQNMAGPPDNARALDKNTGFGSPEHPNKTRKADPDNPDSFEWL